ncbi:MAG: DUF5995 family protein [Acidimicrobiia bacterium]
MSILDPVIERMEEIGARLVEAGDERQHFHGAYTRSTKAVTEDIYAGGFLDAEWTERWDKAFAELYLDAFDIWDRGDDPAGPWRVAFEAAQDPVIPPLRHVLLGINAHINYDLPQALLAVITDEEFKDEAVVGRRAADHAHVDSILVRRVPEEDRILARVEEPGDRTLVDRILQPLNRAGTRRFLKEARAKCWQNASMLSTARRKGPDGYTAELARLEELCRQRVADLVTPRYVIMKLTVGGFGVLLEE